MEKVTLFADTLGLVTETPRKVSFGARPCLGEKASRTLGALLGRVVVKAVVDPSCHLRALVVFDVLFEVAVPAGVRVLLVDFAARDGRERLADGVFLVEEVGVGASLAGVLE